MKDMNYYNTFIEVAEDCPVQVAQIPETKGDAKTIPVLQYEMIAHDLEGKVALYAVESDEYKKFMNDNGINHT